WLAELRIEATRARHNLDTTALTLGLGYEFGSAPSAADVGAFQASRNEWTFLGGASVVANNDFKSQGAAATVEYRRMIHPNVEWDISWIHEGVREAARRNGVATELWVVRSLFDDRLVLGAGIGGRRCAAEFVAKAERQRGGVEVMPRSRCLDAKLGEPAIVDLPSHCP